MSGLRLFLFGVPRLQRNGEPVTISRRKGLALLAYLVLRAQPHSREALATLLWPELDHSRALSNLRRELSRLKSDLGSDVLDADRLHIGLSADADLWIDVDRFRHHLALAAAHEHHFPAQSCEACHEALVRAADLQSARFLEGFNLPDAPQFDDWQFFEAEELSRALADTLHRLIRWYAGIGAYDEAITYGRRWLALDTLHEPAHRELMVLYARAGQQAAALRQYEECARLFDEELGIEPEGETTELYQAIRTRQFPPEQDSSLPPELASPAGPALLPPTAPERYHLEEKIAIGGQGEVFLARDLVTDTPVIIKRLRPELATDSARVTRFLREGEMLAQLEHPNIVHMLAAFEHEGHHCLVMEYVDGGTLADLLAEQGTLSLDQSLSLALELADALGRAHHLGIIHRDLKPGNILLTAAGHPRLTDFGTARLEREEVRLTQTGTLVGSPAYMSPEALRGADLDPRSDIWSLGVILYEMLAGRRPFLGESITQILVRILDHSPSALSSVRDDLPPALIDLIERMLAKEAVARPATMRQVAAEVEAIRAGQWEVASADTHKRTGQSPSRLPSSLSLSGRPFAPADQHIHFTESDDGTRIAYAVVGHGQPLVKVANPLTHLQYDWESPVWRHWVEELSRRHTLIRYDERGCGLSARQVVHFSMEAWVADLEAVVDDLGLERFPIIGTSQGASVAIAYAVRHPERVSHLICCGGYARGRFHRGLTPEQQAETETLLNLIRFGWGKENPAFRQVFATLFVPDGNPEQHRWFTELARITAEPETAARMEHAFYDIDVTDLAPRVKAPALVLHPQGDQMVPFAEGQLLADLLPDARFVPLDSNNHLLLADEPAWEHFLLEVNRFLETPGAAISRQWPGFTPTQAPTSDKLEQEIHFCRAPDGVQIAYASVGDGPPLVKAANWLSHLEYDWQSPVWHHWLVGLAREHRLLRYDERGCGLSDRDVADMSFEAWISDLEAVVRATGIERFPLLGISQGAAIAVAYAYRHPEQVTHLILYGGYARGKLHRGGDAAQEVQVLSDVIRIGWGQEHAAFRQIFTSLFLPGGTQAQFDAFNELQRVSSSAENAARILEGFSQIDVSDLAARLRVPTLVLHAQGDLRIPFAEGRHLASLIPGARFVPLESKNHILQEHEPAWDRFLDEVHAFLQTPGALAPDDLPGAPAALSITRPESSALPTPAPVEPSPDPLIGRERELAEITGLLTGEPPTRLLTLVGPGGIGKTRLATTVAEVLSSHFPDGVTFVPLAPLNEARQIAPAIAERVGLESLDANDKEEQLFHFLAARRQLLVLDNFEHLLDGIPLVEGLLEQTPGLLILVTSREPLNLSVESVYRLSGLAYPEGQGVVDADPTTFGAVALLLQQLHRYEPDLAPGPGEWQQLFRLCRLVSGMPLALVLAASWIELLTLEEIGDEIEGSFELLEADLRDLPARQQSMRAVFNASWERLGQRAQEAMARLSVFRGPFSRAAAQAVAGCSLIILRTLLNKSWLQRREDQFELHELVRQYAALRLQAYPGVEAEARAAHAAYYVGLLEEQELLMKGPQQQAAFARVNVAFEQASTAWRWLLGQGHLDPVVNRMLPALYRYCEGRARASELFPLLQLALDHPAAASEPYLRAILLAAKSVFFISGQPIRFESMGNFVPFYWEDNKAAWQLAREQEIPPFWQIVICYSYGRVADPEEATAFLESLLARLRAEGDEWLLAFGLQHLALLMQIPDSGGAEVAAVTIYLTEALAIMERLGDMREAAYTMRVLGYLWLRQGEFVEAIAQWRQALARLEQVGDWIIAAQIHWHIGDAYLQLGQIDTAFDHYQAMSEMARIRGNRRFAANVVSKQSYEAARYGRLDLALQTRQEALALARAGKDRFVEAWCLWEMGELYRLRGELQEAADWFERSLHHFNQIDDNAGRCFYHRGLADLARARGEDELARIHYRQSLTLAQENGHGWAEAYALTGLVHASVNLGKPEQAGAESVQGLTRVTDTGDRALAAAALVAVARVLPALGNLDLALEIALFLADYPVSWQEVRAQARELRATIVLPPSRVALARARSQGKDLWQLVADARLALADPAVSPLAGDGYSLPAYAIPFVGRSEEIVRLRRLLLAEPEHRLVTITGPGGIGKTRLALQVAAQVRVYLPHGIRFLSLAPLSTPEQIIPALAETLDIDVRADAGARRQLFDYLRDKELLLLLDDFDHLLAGAGLVADILQAAPDVVVLATSREALGLRGEVVVSLGGLAFPGSLEEEGDFPAVTLFLEQAQRLRPAYSFTEADRRTAARISQLVQGMPLALVLAAGWFDMLSLAAIAEEISANLDFLEGQNRDLPARQRSIRATFDYSWKRLSADEQQVLAQLSLFRGGFTRQAAQTVTGASLQTLRSLANKSFLIVVPGERYYIHALLRQFGEAELVASGKAAESRRQHSTYYLRALVGIKANLKSERQQQTLDEIAADIHNVRAAMIWAAEQGETDLLQQALESVYCYYDIPVYGRHEEGATLFKRILEQLPADTLLWARFRIREIQWQAETRRNAPAQVQAELEQWLALFQKAGAVADAALSLYLLAQQHILSSGDFQGALSLFEQSLERYREVGDRFQMAEVQAIIAYCHGSVTDLAHYREYMEQALAMSRSVGNRRFEAFSLANLATAAFAAGAYEQAARYSDEALQLAASLRVVGTMALAEGGLALAHILRGELAAAVTLGEQGLQRERDHQWRPAVMYGLALTALSAAFRGEYAHARQRAAEAIRRAPAPFNLTLAHWVAAIAATGLEENKQAWKHLRTALATAQQLDFKGMLTWPLPIATVLLHRAGDTVGAVELLALASTHPLSPTGWSEQWDLLQKTHAALKGALDPDAYGQAWERGRALSLEAVIAQLLAETQREDALEEGKAVDHAEYEPLLEAVQQLADEQEQANASSETGALKRMVSELQGSLKAAKVKLARMNQLEQELALARRVQQRMLPQIFPAIPGYTFTTRYAPARAVGGDFYDIISLDDDHFAVAIADVAGKGMPAALLMALTRSLLLAEAPRVTSPAALLARVNEQLLAAGDGEMFVTLFYGVIEQTSGSLTYARAGHDYPLLIRAGEVTELDGLGMALGLVPGSNFVLQERLLCLEPGDRLVLYSDGLTDVLAPGGEMYDRERFAEMLRRNASHPPSTFCEAIFAELATFQAGAPQHDDMTMLVVEVAPALEQPTPHSPRQAQAVNRHK